MGLTSTLTAIRYSSPFGSVFHIALIGHAVVFEPEKLTLSASLCVEVGAKITGMSPSNSVLSCATPSQSSALKARSEGDAAGLGSVVELSKYVSFPRARGAMPKTSPALVT